MSFKEYLARGWSCVPLIPGTKKAAVKWEKYQKRLPTQEEVDEWTRAGSTHDNLDQVAIVTGKISGLIVLDIDGDEGWNWLTQHKVGLQQDTPIVCTNEPLRKYHYYFKHPGWTVTNRVRFVPGCDIRGDGGYVAAPPTRHIDGHVYEWIFNCAPHQQELQPCPEWLLPFIGDPRDKHRPVTQATVVLSDGDMLPPDEDWVSVALRGVSEGQRNDTAAKLAGFWLGNGMNEVQVAEMLRCWNLRNPAPLKDKELLTTTASIGRAETKKRAAGGAPDTKPGARRHPPTHAHRSAILEGLNQRLGIKIESITKISGDCPVWKFELGGEVIVQMNTAQLFSQRLFQQKLLEQTGIIPTKEKKWEAVIQLISDVADQVDAGQEATTTGSLRLAVKEYLQNNPPEPWTDEKRTPWGYPFIFQGAGYLFKDELFKFLINTKWLKLSPQELAQRMRNLKMSPQNPRIAGFRPRVWEIPADLMPPGKKTEPRPEPGPVVVPFKASQGTL